MSLKKPKELDFIGIDKESGTVELSIIDDLDWVDEENHLLLLQEKINCYLAFIESGEIYQSYPQAIGREICITIYTKFTPTLLGLEFLTKAHEVIEQAGFTLKCFGWINDNKDETGEWQRVI